MPLFQMLKFSNYRKILFSNIVNRFGDSIDSLIFTWLVYSLTNSASWSAIIFGFNQGTSIIFQPLVGPLVDNKNPKRIMVVSDIIRVCMVLGVLGMYHNNFIKPYYLIITTIVVSIAEAFHMPASVSILQSSMEKEVIDSGMSYNVSLSKISILIGSAIGGIIVSSISIELALLIDVVAFVFSAISVVRVSDTVSMTDNSEKYIYSLKTGFVYLFTNKALVLLCFECILINIAVVPFDALLAPISSEIYRGNADIISLLSITVTIGTIVGALFYNKIKPQNRNLLIINICGISLGLYYFVLVILPVIFGKIIQIIILAILSTIMGMILGIMITYVQTEFIKHVKKSYIGRISAIRYSVTYCLAPITAFIISYMSTKLDIRRIFYFSSAFIMVSFLIMLLIYLLYYREELENNGSLVK